MRWKSPFSVKVGLANVNIILTRTSKASKKERQKLFVDPHWAAPFYKIFFHSSNSSQQNVKWNTLYVFSFFFFFVHSREDFEISIEPQINETWRLKWTIHHICMLQRQLSKGLKLMMMGAQINSVVIQNTPSSICLRLWKWKNQEGILHWSVITFYDMTGVRLGQMNTYFRLVSYFSDPDSSATDLAFHSGNSLTRKRGKKSLMILAERWAVASKELRDFYHFSFA